MSVDMNKLAKELIKARDQLLQEAAEAKEKAGNLDLSIAALEDNKSAKKQDVLATVAEILGDNAPLAIEFEDLKGLTQDKLRDGGFTCTGAFKNFKRYLEDADNIIEPEPGKFGLAVSGSVKVA